MQDLNTDPMKLFTCAQNNVSLSIELDRVLKQAGALTNNENESTAVFISLFVSVRSDEHRPSPRILTHNVCDYMVQAYLLNMSLSNPLVLMESTLN